MHVNVSRLDLTAPTRYMGPRKLLREGTLVKRRRRLRVYLCTDILVLTDAATRSLYRMVMQPPSLPWVLMLSEPVSADLFDRSESDDYARYVP